MRNWFGRSSSFLPQKPSFSIDDQASPLHAMTNSLKSISLGEIKIDHYPSTISNKSMFISIIHMTLQRKSKLSELRECCIGIEIRELDAGHCPHDERLEEVNSFICEWAVNMERSLLPC
ncbi:hypothetical protein IFM89_009459 [Coptis chinensis]|uniref:Uncharacterized protein n=1 Tax=Coptis chinensis TaxID=261450 RepID=A0A835ID60_9MAGN|nr:hypothetical protein IFM89_009459 [Coptis chinensis]